MKNEETWYTTGEVATILGLQLDTIGSYIRQKKMQAVKRGRDYMISADALAQFQRDHTPRRLRVKKE